MSPTHLHRAVDLFERHGITTIPRLRVFLHLHAHGPCTSREVCHATGVTTGFLSALRLALPHLFEETPREDPRRVRYAYSLDLAPDMRKEIGKILGA